MNTKAKSPPVSIAPRWALESIAGNTATIRFDDETTLTLAADTNGMDISIIIPVLNDWPALRKTLQALEPFRDQIEVIVADGRSRDGSESIERELPWVKQIASEPGRVAALARAALGAGGFASGAGHAGPVFD